MRKWGFKGDIWDYSRGSRKDKDENNFDGEGPRSRGPEVER